MNQDYQSTLRASEQVAFRMDDVLAPDAELDFGSAFLPEALARVEELSFLRASERRMLNQIRARGYLATFGLVEEFILPFVIERLVARSDADMTEVRALLTFANEEAKHIALFRRFEEVFDRGFGHRCAVIGPAEAVREHVLGHGELGVGLLVLHIEWMTQQHFLDMVRGETTLEPSFRRLLHQHWLEECQHARIDGFIVEAVAAAASPEERERGFRDYVALLEFLDAGLAQQVEHDRAALEAAMGRELSETDRTELARVQLAALRATFIGSGVRHPRLRSAVANVWPAGLEQLEALGRFYG
jgi:hypothetical protein